MSLRTLFVLGLAIVCGGSAAMGILMMRAPESSAVETLQVVVAKLPIARGQVVSEDLVATRTWPKELVPPKSLQTIEAVVGRTALHRVLAGEPVMEAKLAVRGAGRGLASLIPDGRRAYAIQTSHVATSVAGFVEPGNRVDVLLTLRGGHEDASGGGSSTTLLQAVEILAVDQRLDANNEQVSPERMQSVTVLVTPDQASLLDLGQHMGTLTLSLRNPEDVAEAETEPATVNVLRYTQREPLVDVAAAEKVVALKPVSAELSEPAEFKPVAAAPVHPSKPKYSQIRTLRGRHSGRILVRSDR